MLNRVKKRIYAGSEILTLPSAWRLRLAARLGNTKAMRVRARNLRTSFYLRPRSSDLYTLKEIFGEKVYRDVIRSVGDCKSIIDLGANIGLASLYFADQYPDTHIFAVEAYPPTFAILKKNLANPKIRSRCRTMNIAAWSANEDVEIHTPEKGEWFSRMSVAQLSASRTKVARIPGRTMEEILTASNFSYVDLLKIDIEGAETELFRGEAAWLENIGAIAIEFHGDSRNLCKFDEKVRAHGFQIWEEGNHTILAFKPPLVKA